MISWITLFLLAVLSTSRAARGKFESKKTEQKFWNKISSSSIIQRGILFVLFFLLKYYAGKKILKYCWAGIKKKQHSDGCHICSEMLKVMSIIRHIIWAHLSSKITIFPLKYSLTIVILLNLWNHGKLLFRLLLTYILLGTFFFQKKKGNSKWNLHDITWRRYNGLKWFVVENFSPYFSYLMS